MKYVYPGKIKELVLHEVSPFQLFLFISNPDVVETAEKAGIDGFIVDLETRGKESRQVNYDTQISEADVNDLVQVRSKTDRLVICRINGFYEQTAREVETVISAGADEIFLPMVRTTEDVKRTLDFIRGRCGLAILVETTQAVRISEELGKLPLARVYVGLNDLAIDRGLKNIFTSVSDGTVEDVRRHFSVPFGFGGLTLPGKGHPIPCRLLIGEMARMRCQFSFLRRSFYRDVEGKDMVVEVPQIVDAIRAARTWTEDTYMQNKQELTEVIAGWSGGSFVGGN